MALRCRIWHYKESALPRLPVRIICGSIGISPDSLMCFLWFCLKIIQQSSLVRRLLDCFGKYSWNGVESAKTVSRVISAPAGCRGVIIAPDFFPPEFSMRGLALESSGGVISSRPDQWWPRASQLEGGISYFHDQRRLKSVAFSLGACSIF